MLELLRKKAQSPYLQAAVLIIILVFIFWGVGSNQGSGPNAVASVNGQAITARDYQQVYDQLLAGYRDQFGGRLPEQLLQSLNLKEQALNQLIERTLVQQGAREMGLLVSEEEIRKAIQEMDVFQENGAFEFNRYKQVLSASRLTASDFEAGLRADLLTRKVTDLLADFARISPQEIRKRFLFDYSETKLEYASLKADAFKEKVQETEEALAAYFEEHKAEYKTAPQIKVSYLSFPFEETASAIEVQPAEVEQHYQQNRAQFLIPEQRRARHILIKSAEDAPAEQLAAKRKQAEEILAQATAGKDFASLAKKHSEDGSAAQGGDLGFFSRGQMVPAFEQAVFSLAKGEISEVVKSRFGFHIIKLEEIRPEQVQSLSQVREFITAGLRREKASALAFEQANKAYEQIILSGSLRTYAEKSGADLKTTDFFSRQSPPAELAADRDFLAAAFTLQKGELSSLIAGEKGYAILYVEESREPEIPSLAAVREQVAKDFVAARSLELAREAARNLLAAVKKGDDFNQEAKSLGIAVHESEFISRLTAGDGDVPSPVLREGLKLNAASPYPETVVEADRAFYVFRFKEKQEPPAELFAEKEEEIRQQVLQEEQGTLLAGWLGNLRQKAEITRNENLLL